MGKRERPDGWMRQWRLPGWEYRLWTEADIRALPLRNVAQFDWFASRKRWNGAADIARAEILLAFGGVYHDADSIPLGDWADPPFMAAGFFAGIAEGERVANGTIGSEPGHRVLEDYVAHLGKVNVNDMLPPSRKVGSVLLTRSINRFPGDDVQVLARRVFYPVSKGGKPIPGPETPYAQHFWAGSNGLYDVPR